MKILALEFATDQRSVAVLDGTTVRGTALTAATRHTPAVGLITQALAAAGWEREAIELVAVGLGPGSYTGLRTAIALAQGWQLAGGDHGVRLWGGSSVETLAREAWLQGVRGPLSVVVDAQRQEFYLAGYVLDSAGPQAVAPLRVATLAETQARAAAGDLLAGPDITRWFPAGLHGRDLCIIAAPADQLVVRADLRDRAVVEHDDEIRPAQHAQAMGHQKGRSRRHRRVHGFDDLGLRALVDGGRRVHQDALILTTFLVRGGCFRPLLAFEDGGLQPIVKPPVIGLPIRKAGGNLELAPAPGKRHPQEMEDVDSELDILPSPDDVHRGCVGVLEQYDPDIEVVLQEREDQHVGRIDRLRKIDDLLFDGDAGEVFRSVGDPQHGGIDLVARHQLLGLGQRGLRLVLGGTA